MLPPIPPRPFHGDDSIETKARSFRAPLTLDPYHGQRSIIPLGAKLHAIVQNLRYRIHFCS